MRIRTLIPPALCLAGLFMAACDSSSSSPTGAADPKDPDAKVGGNGTLVIDGKTLPIEVNGSYDDTSMGLYADTRVAGSTDSGWIIQMTAKPGKATVALAHVDKYSLVNSATHDIAGSDSSCFYAISSGSIHVDAWSETAYGSDKVAKLSGGATVTLTPFSPSSDCKGISGTLAFTDAAAAMLGP